MHEHDLSLVELASACGVSKTLVEHWLDLEHDSRPGLENVAMMPAPIRDALMSELAGELGQSSPVLVPADARAHVAQVVEALGACSTAFARAAASGEAGEHELRGVRESARAAEEHAAGVRAWATGGLEARTGRRLERVR